ncbi:beta-propeller fold lactonase family protein [Kribbella sandramycini]|uniref:Beta-propeller fold lactonase family protein n=1 Tax=Kribbella sandramycini TaxID=60450 RepID=A0A7Y4L6I5_9ACTN|nr:YVTN family beta-propeller protein [Kribbella sandramycini]NOL45294.1 beta-propeller fold lactonase family protein [Kribbella sandramycini]
MATYEYDDGGLRQLVSPAQDAEALAEVLRDPAVAGYDVQVLINESSSRVGEAIGEFYESAERDDLTLLYFSGHGLKDDNGRLYLATKNTNRERLRFTSLPARIIDEAVDESVARQKVLILDCCYGGAYAVQRFAKADTTVDTKAALGGRGRIVLTATEATQYAFEGAQVHGQAAQSVFTRHVVEGLRSGAADLDYDGDITVDELYRYVYEKVVAEQPGQRPKQIAETEGRTVIAGNSHWSFPASIDADLRQPLRREAAFAQLGKWLEATNTQVRRSTRAKLEELLTDDSRAVAAMAQSYLDRPARPEPIEPVRRPTGPTFGAAARASSRRWRHRLGLLRGTAAGLHAAAANWWVSALLLVAAGLAITAAVLRITPYSIALAVVVSSAFALSFRGRAFISGLLPPAVLSTAIAAPDVLMIAAHLAWLAAIVISLPKRRPTMPGVQRGQLIPAVLAALLVLFLVVDQYRSPSGFDAIPHLTSTAVLGLIAAEFALIAPLLDFGRAVTAGSVVGGFAVWSGLFAVEQPIVWALLAVWLLIGVLTIARPRRSGVPIGRLVTAGLLTPAVLGGVAFAVVPAAPRAPIAAAIALSSDDRTLYVADISNDRVLKIDTTTREQVGTAVPVGDRPVRLLLTPDGATLYVANAEADTISVIDVATWTAVDTPIPVAPEPIELALSPARQRLYVLSAKAETITEIDTAERRTVGGPLASGPNPGDIAVDANGERLYVANQDAGTVSVIDTATRQPARSPIKVGAKPRDLAPGPEGALYVIGASSYAVINTKVETSRPTPVELPNESAFGVADGKYLYVASRAKQDDELLVVDVGSRAVVRSLTDDALGLTIGLAVGADGRRLYATGYYQDGIVVLDSAGSRAIGVIGLKR